MTRIIKNASDAGNIFPTFSSKEGCGWGLCCGNKIRRIYKEENEDEKKKKDEEKEIKKEMKEETKEEEG